MTQFLTVLSVTSVVISVKTQTNKVVFHFLVEKH